VMPGGFVPVGTHPTLEATMRRLILGSTLAGLLGFAGDLKDSDFARCRK
jgi:hypothetical protein